MRWLRYIIVPNNTNNNEFTIVPALWHALLWETDVRYVIEIIVGEVNRVIVNLGNLYIMNFMLERCF